MIPFFQLIRLKVSILVGLSCFAGTCLYEPIIGINHLLAVGASILLASGCSAINQYQEYKLDSLMLRTQKRPVPDGTLLPREALILGLLILMLSLCFIYLSGSVQGLLMAFLIVVIYNLVYTPLKKRTPFALLAGSVIGAFPPLLGYTVCGGSPFDSEIIMVSMILFLWQTPHFATLVGKYKEEYSNAGFKTIFSEYGDDKSELFINVWGVAYVSSLLLMPITDIYDYDLSATFHVGITVVSVVMFMLSKKNFSYRFISLNGSMFAFFILLIADKVTLPPL